MSNTAISRAAAAKLSTSGNNRDDMLAKIDKQIKELKEKSRAIAALPLEPEGSIVLFTVEVVVPEYYNVSVNLVNEDSSFVPEQEYLIEVYGIRYVNKWYLLTEVRNSRYVEGHTWEDFITLVTDTRLYQNPSWDNLQKKPTITITGPLVPHDWTLM